ncbi:MULTISPECIES: glycosyltransferase family 2 protein [unclassified Pseudonocardia]|jgi:glycosyltransferase involved in cell wall biosynthesis|uniref:glycosyltransferase family 2 protein n=1 Tax=unclassified Pseudonocardia TaxID=2619320 RepID=UPI000967169F|nr:MULTISPECIES: glycosyltransferase family 2 protein [unclassified Pseudonocardia]MBN9096819.1 glycosyltransferase family 2 protein [Pseudonocardia sp.]OJY49505.1 MAG: glycosyltransferase [Pseudonocardia sp. 73-21]
MIDVILPCLDEAQALPGVLAALPPGFRGLVVDNGSTDGTPEVAAALGAVVVHESRRGYGAAVHTGLAAATSEIVAFVDADGSLDPGQLPAMVELLDPADDQRVDLVAGRRVPVGRGAWPWHARAGNVAIAALLRRRGVPVHDIAPLRVARRQALLDLGITDRAFGYPLELLVRAGAAGWRIREIDVAYRPRTGGRSKVSGSVRGTLRAARDMASVLQ